jgi:transposase
VSQFAAGVEKGSAAGEDQGGVAGLGFSSGGHAPEAGVVPDPELVEKARRRKFTAAYKLSIVTEADGLTGAGEIGALLRREGLYSSHLGKWRAQRDAGALGGLEPRRRGPVPPSADAVALARVRRERDKAVSELQTARRVIEVQGNVSALLEELLSKSATQTDEASSQR